MGTLEFIKTIIIEKLFESDKLKDLCSIFDICMCSFIYLNVILILNTFLMLKTHDAKYVHVMVKYFSTVVGFGVFDDFLWSK